MSTKTKNEYDVDIVRVVDGDTVDVDIHLGFNVVLRNERVRIVGIDTPESRTSDPVEKVFGLAAKRRVHELLNTENIRLITTENSKGEDMRGKFGRVLGDFRVNNGHSSKRATRYRISVDPRITFGNNTSPIASQTGGLWCR